MGNSGYIINDYVTQIFTTGPNSGSLVSSSFITAIDSESISICNNTYYQKVFNPVVCAVDGYCVNPTINLVEQQYCDSSYNYTYHLSYNINSSSLSIPQSIIEYSLDNSFTGPTGSMTVNNSGSLNNINVNISSGSGNLNPLPLNQYTPVYFRVKNICSGSLTSLYSNIGSASCTPPPVLYEIIGTLWKNVNIEYGNLTIYPSDSPGGSVSLNEGDTFAQFSIMAAAGEIIEITNVIENEQWNPDGSYHPILSEIWTTFLPENLMTPPQPGVPSQPIGSRIIVTGSNELSNNILFIMPAQNISIGTTLYSFD